MTSLIRVKVNINKGKVLDDIINKGKVNSVR